MKYAETYGVSRARRKYNKNRSHIYFWKQRWDSSVESLACQSRRPHSHPNQHTEAELMKQRNKNLAQKKKLLADAEKRIVELDNIIKCIYEDNITDKLTDERFHKRSQDYEVDIYYKGIGILKMSKVFDDRQK